MTDLTLTHSGELDVTQVEGNTDLGIEFVDRWTQSNLIVVDAGRIIIRDTYELIQRAAGFGLTIEHKLVAAETPS